MNEQEIFSAALELAPAQRDSFLKEACGANDQLRLQVQDLLRLYEPAEGLFEKPAAEFVGSQRVKAVETSGDTIGPFTLLEKLGEGGMGAVYVAEQTDPVHRKVALKVIKPGMDTSQVVARFEAERQALAMMNHPNIAKALDAGATDSGRPYFVMEIVNGIPVTEYCDRHRLDIHQRLELFTAICLAVHHAHQKGVIHCDLKPSNILVEMHDARAVPKVIDFGVAKATNQQPTMRTRHTGVTQLTGTPAYMSPEQTELSGLDVDTRSDIYSLGILMYELLIGTTPLESNVLSRVASDELRRMIREDEPLRPSERFTTMAQDEKLSVSDQRKSDTRRLTRDLKCELDWIVMRALEKDRTQRYESASALAADVQRYLHGEVVLACPPSSAYRLRRFARKRKGLLTSASVILLAMVIGTGASLWYAGQAGIAAEVADVERQKASSALEEKSDALGQATENLKIANEQRTLARKNLQKAIDTMDRMYVGFVKNWLANSTHLSSVQYNYLLDALAFYQELTADLADKEDQMALLAVAYSRIGEIKHYLGDFSAAASAWRRAIELGEGQLKLEPKDPLRQQNVADWNVGLGTSLEDLGLLVEADQAYQKSLAIAATLVQQSPSDTRHQAQLALARLRRAAVLARGTDTAEAVQLVRSALETLRSPRETWTSPRRSILEHECVREWSRMLWRRGRLQRAMELVSNELDDCRTMRVQEFSDLRPLMVEEVELTILLGDLKLESGDTETAIKGYRDALDLQRQTLRAKLEPVLFDHAYQQGTVSWDAHWEPRPFVKYIQIEQRLAKALRKHGRPHEAEIALGNCLSPAAIIDDIERGLPHGIAQANSAALASQLLRDIRKDDADKLLSHASDEWCRILGEFPHAATSVSGVHGLEADLAWFRKTFPNETVTPRRRKADEPHKYGINAGEGTAFLIHAGAHQALRAEKYEFAIEAFTESARLRKTAAEFDWLYLAIANARIGRLSEASRWLKLVDGAIAKQGKPDSELDALRDRAIALLADE